jgi:hypothetical protein
MLKEMYVIMHEYNIYQSALNFRVLTIYLLYIWPVFCVMLQHFLPFISGLYMKVGFSCVPRILKNDQFHYRNYRPVTPGNVRNTSFVIEQVIVTRLLKVHVLERRRV